MSLPVYVSEYKEPSHLSTWFGWAPAYLASSKETKRLPESNYTNEVRGHERKPFVYVGVASHFHLRIGNVDISETMSLCGGVLWCGSLWQPVAVPSLHTYLLFDPRYCRLSILPDLRLPRPEGQPAPRAMIKLPPLRGCPRILDLEEAQVVLAVQCRVCLHVPVRLEEARP